jgi:DNA-binding transcriptional ArsR family regulator
MRKGYNSGYWRIRGLRMLATDPSFRRSRATGTGRGRKLRSCYRQCMSSNSDEQKVVRLEDCRVRVVDHDQVAVVAASMPALDDVAEAAGVFGLLADPGRLRVLVALLEGEMCVCDLAAVAKSSESAVSHHLRLLRAHRVVHVRRAGRMAYYRLADAHVRMLLDVALAHIGHAPAAAYLQRDQIPEGRR